MPAAVAIPLVTAAVGASATAYGAHSAGKSARRAADVTAKADTDTLALERERDAEARRQWEADQQQKAKEFAAAEEERAFARQQAEIAAADRAYQQQLLREREQRAAPYRAMSQQALGNLGSLLGIDMSGSALAQNLSAPRSTGPTTSAPMPMTPTPPQPPRGPMQGGTPLPPGMQNLQAPTLGDLIAQQQRGVSRAY